MSNLDSAYWNNRFDTNNTPWDIGYVSTPIKDYIDQLKDKNISILIPGCGNSYEAEYLLKQGFNNITLIDISPILTKRLAEKFNNVSKKKLNIITGDFFNLKGQFDLIIEQTFFCALNPNQRKDYVNKMYALLKPGKKLVGVLFNRHFEGGPPFGGSTEEYEKLFAEKFVISKMELCYNSISPRKGNEVFVVFVKKG
ncbi:MAG TPA: methyltransferase domain-containing protein [Chitinophagaceae bacterium]|nr:methyltransferase domain-containing protein [Chitinophagaceae bacterium]